MSHEARLSRLGLSHLADKPEELAAELKRSLAIADAQSKIGRARQEERRKVLEAMSPQEREQEHKDLAAKLLTM